MKRKAILIGNTNGLNGVKIDIMSFSAFLKSDTGGSWYDSEITMLHNPKKADLVASVAFWRSQSYDYVIVLFSGHGGQLRNDTVLEINGDGETINESTLRHIASRQLNIYDCCRAHPQPAMESIAAMDSLNYMEKRASSIRLRYEARIMEAIPQQVLLYSCSVGEYSYDTPNGAVYLSGFLGASKSFASTQSFMLVGVAHQFAAQSTVESCKDKKYKQNPEAYLPKCLSSQQLIISVH